MSDPVDQGDVVNLMLEGLLLSESSMRCTIIWAGEEYPCTGGPELGGKRIDEGGYRLHSRVKIKVRNAVFGEGADVPEEKQTIEYKRSANAVPKRYRIDAKTNYYDAFMELELNNVDEGA